MQRIPNLVLTLVFAGAMTLPVVPVTSSPATAHAVGVGDRTHPSVMEQAATQLASMHVNSSSQFGAAERSAAPMPLASRAATPLQREVFGFVNAANLGDPSVGYPSWNLRLLSTVAFFGLQVNSGDGHLVAGTDLAWNVFHSSTMANFVNLAHANGTRVIVSINLHDFSTSPTNQVCVGLQAANYANTILWTQQAIAAEGIDGVNIDYEGSDTTCANGLSERQQLVSFMHDLRAALPTQYIAIDTYSGSAEDNLEFFDVTGIAPYVDSFFVMAYDMDEANYSEAPLNCTSYCFNPISPLNTYRFNVTKSMTQYTALVPASKVILGQPYYARRGCAFYLNQAHDYRVPNTNFVSPTYSFASTVPSQGGVVGYTAFRDPLDGVSQWDTWYDTDWNCNRQQFWDDTVSLGAKYDLVNAMNLRGVGFWTLDYAGGAPELWNLIAAKFTATTVYSSLGGVPTSSPDASSGSPNHLDVFVRGNDNALYHRSWDGTTWSPWESLGGILTSAPSAVSWGTGRVDVFVRGSDYALYQKTWNGSSWSPWQRLGGTLTSGPDAASWGAGRIDVFVSGTDYQMYHLWLNASGWHGWEPLGGTLTSDPTVVSWGPNRLDVFVRGTTDALYHKWWDGSAWHGWENLGGILTTGPDASSCTAGHLDVFALGTDRGLWQKGWTGSGWTAWQPQGGRFVTDPSATCITGTNNVALFEVGIDGAVWYTTLPAS